MRHAPAPPPARTPEILLVDDNRQGLIARKSLLQELGYNISTATSGDEALALLSKHNFDVVVTDFKMPRMDGVELIKQIRSAQAGARIILLSGFVEPLGLTEESTGADVVIVKSAGEVGQLTRCVKRLLSQPPARKPAGSAKGDTAARRRGDAATR
jgi:CheY-like chemotaxis protein